MLLSARTRNLHTHTFHPVCSKGCSASSNWLFHNGTSIRIGDTITDKVMNFVSKKISEKQRDGLKRPSRRQFMEFEINKAQS